MVKHPTKLWNLQYISLLILSTLTSITFNMTTPVLPRYALDLRAGLTAAGMLSGLFSITSLVFRPISGAIADRVDRKRLLLLSMAVTVISICGYAVSGSFTALLLCRLLHGASFAVSSTLSMALATEYIPNEKMGEGVGYLGLSSTLALAIGPGIGLALSSMAYSISFLASAASTAAGMLLLLFIPSHRITPGSVKPALHVGDFVSAPLIPLAVLGGLFTLVSGLNTTFLSMLGTERGIGSISIFFTVCSAVLLVARPASGKFADRYGLPVIIYPAYACSAAAMFILAYADSLSMCILAAVFCALGQGSGQPALQAECLRKLGRERSGVATSTFLLGADIMNGLGSMAGGTISDSFGYKTMYLICSALMIFGAAAFMLYRAASRRKSSKQRSSHHEQ